MGTAKVISLKARPSQVSNLCFEVDGILASVDTQLGAEAVAFDFAAFYATLAAAPTTASDPSRLRYDAPAIASFVKPNALASLRSEPRRLALDKAITARQSSYFSKYGSIPSIVAELQAAYAMSNPSSKYARLNLLKVIAQQQADQLQEAYFNDGRTGVVRNTTSVLNSTTQSSGGSSLRGVANETSLTSEIGVGSPYNSPTLPNLPPPGQSLAGWTFVGDDNIATNANMAETDSAATTNTSQESVSRAVSSETQTITNTDYAYRVPLLESQAQGCRALISIVDQMISQFMYNVSLPNLEQILQNELRSIDGDVCQLQLAFLSTVLAPPFSGTVTGIYKNPGDPVRAGEPVVRVENNGTVFLIATLVYRGAIVVGSNVKVSTNLFDDSGTPTTIKGVVVAARGHQSEDDRWDVVVSCANPLSSGGAPIIPLNYHFDYDNTVVDIS